LRSRIEQQQNDIWKLTKERDVHIYEKELLENELKLSHDTLGDATKIIKSLDFDIDQEKLSIQNESVRHQYVVKFLTENKNNMHSIQENLKNCLDNKIVDIHDTINNHDNYHNENLQYLNEQ